MSIHSPPPPPPPSPPPTPHRYRHRRPPACFPGKVPEKCSGLEDTWSFYSGHAAITAHESNKLYKYSYVMMIRNPQRRLLSAYSHGSQRKNECSHCTSSSTLIEFASSHARNDDTTGPAGEAAAW